MAGLETGESDPRLSTLLKILAPLSKTLEAADLNAACLSGGNVACQSGGLERGYLGGDFAVDALTHPRLA